MLPKITRRLRDDERKQIASGTIFVFDEVESSIKRWTDGMIWSPSRILNNFLVYREVEKKDPKPSPDQPAFVTNSTAYGMPAMPSSGGSNVNFHASVRNVPLTLMPNAMDADAQMIHYKQEHTAYQGLDHVTSSSNAVYADHDSFFGHPSHAQHSAHPQAHPQAAGLVGVMDDHAGPSNTAKREVELDRTIVGSLTSSYPFVRDGLCKKTISIQVEGSTQHLISYYKIDDVHNSRLTIPSTLPELSSLSISPIFLNKANFRYPPIVEIGPDGVPRYVGESTDNAMRASGHVSSGNESFSSSEARQDGMGRPASRSLSIYSPGLPSDAPHGDMHTHRYPHQIGGDGMLPASATPLPTSSTSIPYRSRRSSDAPRRRANSRFEPYHPPAPMTFGHGMAAHSLYSNAPTMDNGPVSPSGRRAFFAGTRSYSDMEPGAPYPSDHGAFGVPRQQDDGFLGMTHVGQASNANGGSHASHMDQQHPSMETVDSHGSFQHSFQPGSMIPMVPSQPTRSDVSWSKQEQQDPFHFSSRLARGSWDSNQPNHSTSFVHNLQQPPATSQGLTALPIHSQSNVMSSSFYPRFAGSPPNTGSSHDSRHSYAASTGRNEEYVEGVHPPTATRLEDTVHYSSRPISRAGEAGYANDLDAAGVVKTGGLEALHVHSDPASPYPRPQQQQQTQQQVSASDAAAFDSYGRASGAVEAQQSYYAQPPSHAEASHDSLQLDQQAFGRHAAAYPASHDVGNASARNEHTSWTSTPAGEGNGAVSSRPGTSHDQGYHRQFRTDASDAGAADDSGFEKVMLTRPALP
ncbi:cAMP-independent regulatory protein [Pseudozyma hubeiensis SY62]|uniref:cAMP-independent regulatory protein n=1 Tax=Pseudozyma hubeiensis (strain SY62) TaxID=1305764 RepID=R9PLE9_PSEHS|nr:cAMP-independent regulatory protein [Pseudozyma hubeiensis SY62]GAC98910.1 cAMP-independent regulatory protein [Pseudozyma hubeiensis SY62]